MNPSSTLRVRRAIAGLFLVWAVGAIVLSLGGAARARATGSTTRSRTRGSRPPR